MTKFVTARWNKPHVYETSFVLNDVKDHESLTLNEWLKSAAKAALIYTHETGEASLTISIKSDQMPSKLFLLRLINDIDGIVVRATDAAEARRIAASRHSSKEDVWLDPQRSVCKRLTMDGEPGVILSASGF